MTTTTPAIELFAAAYLRLYGQVHGSDIAESQWKIGQTPVPREDTTERSRGLTNDPVPTATFDTRRLNLRAAVIEGERALRDADRALAHALRTLEAAIDRANSETSEPTSGG